jgi:hypothetical protein
VTGVQTCALPISSNQKYGFGARHLELWATEVNA